MAATEAAVCLIKRGRIEFDLERRSVEEKEKRRNHKGLRSEENEWNCHARHWTDKDEGKRKMRKSEDRRRSRRMNKIEEDRRR